jgi:hypothetical protein
MKLKEVETIKNQSEALGVSITVVPYDVQRYSITIGKHVYTNFNKALSALTTVYLKGKK